MKSSIKILAALTMAALCSPAFGQSLDSESTEAYIDVACQGEITNLAPEFELSYDAASGGLAGALAEAGAANYPSFLATGQQFSRTEDFTIEATCAVDVALACADLDEDCELHHAAQPTMYKIPAVELDIADSASMFSDERAAIVAGSGNPVILESSAAGLPVNSAGYKLGVLATMPDVGTLLAGRYELPLVIEISQQP